MHTHVTKSGTRIHFNSDFSGEFRITNKEGSVQIRGEELVEFFTYYKEEFEDVQKRLDLRDYNA